MNDGALRAMLELYGAGRGESLRRLREPESSAYIDDCSGDECNSIDEASDRSTVIPKGVAKRLFPEQFFLPKDEGGQK